MENNPGGIDYFLIERGASLKAGDSLFDQLFRGGNGAVVKNGCSCFINHFATGGNHRISAKRSDGIDETRMVN